MDEKVLANNEAISTSNLKAIIDQMITALGQANTGVQSQRDMLFNDMLTSKQRYDALAFNALARTVHNGITIDAKMLDPGAHEVASENISADIAEDPEDNEVKGRK